jgi:hypothetical protein
MLRTTLSRCVALAALSFGAGGCYRYQPLAQPEPATGDNVRVSLTQDGTTALATRLGPRISQLDARVAEVRSDTLLLQVTTARSADLQESYFNGDTVSLPRSSVSSIEERRLAVGPTAVLGGIVVGGALTAATALTGDNGNGGAPPVGGQKSPQ